MNNALFGQLDMLNGRVKVLASISEASKADILKIAADFTAHPVDICEWRIDCFESCSDVDAVLDALRELRSVLGDFPILATVRTAAEGGCISIEPANYEALAIAIIDSGNADGIDIELFKGDEIVGRLVAKAHEAGVAVVLSNHDFNKTPSEDEMKARLIRMGELGADIAKIAVMPASESDVDSLLEVTRKVSRENPKLPILTISMGELGVRSRTDGWRYGSCATFGCIGKPSAPGQVSVEKLAARGCEL